MYSSLRSLLNVALEIHPYLKMDSAGDKEYGPSNYTLCYPEGKVTVVTDEAGTEHVSSKALYVNGTVTIKESDEVTFDNVRYHIKSLGEYYDKGQRSIWVVYV